MNSDCTSFGKYLKYLIEKSRMTQTEFYSRLGIKKPYFYDILSGRVNPPPPKLQFKAMEILEADYETRTKFFDLAAKSRGEIPADITMEINDNPTLMNNIRDVLKQIIASQKKENNYEREI